MSVETYNPNEVAKVKHLIALAESIAEKFDGGGGGGKQTPTITLSKTSCTVAELKDSSDTSSAFAIITTNSDGALFVKQTELSIFQSVVSAIYKLEGMTAVVFFCVKNSQGQTQVVPQTVTIYQAETDTYKAAEVTFTITA